MFTGGLKFCLACTGRVVQWCQLSGSSSIQSEAVKIALATFGLLLLVAVIIFVCLRWKVVVNEFSAARVNRIKRR